MPSIHNLTKSSLESWEEMYCGFFFLVVEPGNEGLERLNYLPELLEPDWKLKELSWKLKSICSSVSS